MIEFVHLTVHSEYSLVDGVVRIPALVENLERMGMPAAGLTDQSNVFAMVKFYRAAVGRGIKPIIGADVWVGESLEDREPSRLTLLCANAAGFGNLSTAVDVGVCGGSAARPGACAQTLARARGTRGAHRVVGRAVR